jgi:hypothetical protein
MKNASWFFAALVGLLTLSPVQANDTQKTFTFHHKGTTWTIQADRLARKGTMVYLRGNVKATSKRGDKISADTAELCLKPGQEKLVLSPVKSGTIVKATREASAKTH